MNRKNIRNKINEYMSKELLIVTFAIIFYLLERTVCFNDNFQDWVKTVVFHVQSNDYAALDYYRYIIWFLSSFIFLFVLPFVVSLLMEKKQVWVKFGLKFVKSKLGIYLLIFGLFIMFVAIIIAAKVFPAFTEYYPLSDYAAVTIGGFIFFEICYFSYFVGWEFLYRGFLLFPFEKKFGKSGAILIGAMPFVLAHVGKPIPEVIGSFIAAIFLGILALETRSIWYGVLLHGLVAVFMDVVATYI